MAMGDLMSFPLYLEVFDRRYIPSDFSQLLSLTAIPSTPMLPRMYDGLNHYTHMTYGICEDSFVDLSFAPQNHMSVAVLHVLPGVCMMIFPFLISYNLDTDVTGIMLAYRYITLKSLST